MSDHFCVSSVDEREKMQCGVCVEWLRNAIAVSVNDKVCTIPLNVKNADDFIKWLYKEV